MEMFSSLDKYLTLCRPKIARALLTPLGRGVSFWSAFPSDVFQLWVHFGPHCWLPKIHLQSPILLVYAQYKLWPRLPPRQLIPFGAKRLQGAPHRCRPCVVYTIGLCNQAHGLEKVPRWASICSWRLRYWVQTKEDWHWCMHQWGAAVSQ